MGHPPPPRTALRSGRSTGRATGARTASPRARALPHARRARAPTALSGVWLNSRAGAHLDDVQPRAPRVIDPVDGGKVHLLQLAHHGADPDLDVVDGADGRDLGRSA